MNENIGFADHNDIQMYMQPRANTIKGKPPLGMSKGNSGYEKLKNNVDILSQDSKESQDINRGVENIKDEFSNRQSMISGKNR